MKRITVLLADGNNCVRSALKRLLELEADLEIVGEAVTGPQAVTLAKQLHPAVVLMDIAVPMLNGLKATREILTADPTAKVLLLSVDGDDAYVQEAINSGAAGYLIKHSSIGSFILAIRRVHQGKNYFSPVLSTRFQTPISPA